MLDLSQKIQSVDAEYKKAQKKLETIAEVTRELTKKRSALKELTTREQNAIFQLEEKLTKRGEGQYRSEIPDFLRPLISFLTRVPDEIDLMAKISKLEAKVSQRESFGTEINESLARSLVSAQGYQDALQIFLNLSEKYRTYRMQLGRINRESQSQLKKEKNLKENNSIIQSYLQNMEELKTLGPNLMTNLMEKRKSANDLIQEKLNQLTQKKYEDQSKL